MKHIQFIMPLFTPDIMEYITGRDVVCRLVLEECKLKSAPVTDSILPSNRLFADLRFTMGEITEIISAVAKQLIIKIPYTILLRLEKHSTIEDLATQLWKYMCRVVKCN
ncbi:MAG: hypothetical protein JST86_18345 [Bacteroidetes bacterium]|nr:hypothetical protein [Bacteroidota bacterium]